MSNICAICGAKQRTKSLEACIKCGKLCHTACMYASKKTLVCKKCSATAKSPHAPAPIKCNDRGDVNTSAGLPVLRRPPLTSSTPASTKRVAAPQAPSSKTAVHKSAVVQGPTTTHVVPSTVPVNNCVASSTAADVNENQGVRAEEQLEHLRQCKNTSVNASGATVAMQETSVESCPLSNNCAELMSTMVGKFDVMLECFKSFPAFEAHFKTIIDNLHTITDKLRGHDSMLEEYKATQSALLSENGHLKETINNMQKEFSERFDLFKNFISFEISDKHSMLFNRLDENLEVINNNIDYLNSEVATVANTVSDLTIIDSDRHSEQTHSRLPHIPPPTVDNVTEDSQFPEIASLIISGAVGHLPNNITCDEYAFAVFSTVMPSLNKTDIISSQPLSRHKGGNGPVDASALLVRFSSSDLPTQILKQKCRFTAFSTRDLDASRYPWVPVLPCASIYINEYLLREKYMSFKNLKKSAKKLGFKYVWHRSGRFFVKTRDGGAPLTFISKSDLESLAKIHICDLQNGVTTNAADTNLTTGIVGVSATPTISKTISGNNKKKSKKSKSRSKNKTVQSVENDDNISKAPSTSNNSKENCD